MTWLCVCVCVCVCVCSGLLHLVQQQKEKVLIVHSTVSQARANMDTMMHIIQVSVCDRDNTERWPHVWVCSASYELQRHA